MKARPAEPALRRIHFDLTTVRLFIATAETGSITRAAERICLAPAAASRRIKELETQFGVVLFQRKPHGMALTDAGMALLAHARGMTHAVARMHDDAQAFRRGDKGVVRIAACTSVVLQFLPLDLRRCQTDFPGINIDLQELNSDGVIQAVSRGVADIGLYESTLGAVPLPSLPYHQDRLVLVMHRDHPLADRQRVRLEDFLAYAVIGLGEGSAISTTLARVAAEVNCALHMPIRVRSFESMTAMIAEGIGIGVMPKKVARAFATGKRFCCLDIDGDWAARRFVLCHQPAQAMSSAALTVVQALAGVNSQMANPA